MSRLSLVLLVAVLSILIARPTIGQAQDLALTGRRPRFIAAWAAPGQPADASRMAVLTRRVTLDLDGVPLAAALQAIAERADLDLSYQTALLPVGRAVSLHVRDITVAAALTEVLLNSDLDVAVSRAGRLALVRARELVTGSAVQDSGRIAGRVIDKKTGAGLVGAVVAIEGTSRSATSGTDGRYRIAGVVPGTYTVGGRYIGYAPSTVVVTVSADQEATADFALERSAQQLDEVVTTGTVVPTEVRALPTPISVISADQIEQRGYQRVDQIFRGDVPGAIAWDQGPIDDYSTIAVRGASALISTNSGIKTFIDGVEIADITRLATIDPNSIDRIEITRGPQASTMYGAGALNGVMQIFTKKGELGLTHPEVTAKISAGGVGGYDGKNTAPQTDDALSVFGGGNSTSYDLGGLFRHVGEWVPSYTSTGWGATAGGQTRQGPITLSSSLRYVDKARDYPWDTRFISYPALSKPYYQTNRIREQTYGVTAGLQATRRWQHTLTLGYDQVYYDYHQTQPRFTTPDDSLLVAYALHQAKVSLLYHSDLGFQLGSRIAATATAGANYEALDYGDAYTFNATRTTGTLDGVSFVSHAPSHNAGYFGQVQVGFADRLFLIAGLRAERNSNFGTDFGTAWSPRFGAAYVLGLGPATVKLRASYGESIRAPDTGQRDANISPFIVQLANPALAPERQRGADGGVEVYVGRASLGVTYYNQRAINLIQQVTVPTPAGTVPTYQYQNLARVKNEGWEFEAHVPLGPVGVGGTFSITNSTVQALPPGFAAGNYQVGDAILGIPHTSAGATITYSPLRQTTITASMTHLGHWIQTDYVPLLGYFYGGLPYLGSPRAYWMQYPTVTKFAVGVTQQVTRNVSAFVRAENVGNNLRYEQDNGNFGAVPRSVLVGANVRY